MPTEQQKQELERILKEINTKYGFTWGTLYYKYKGEMDEGLHRVFLISERTIRDIPPNWSIFSPRLEYAVYVEQVYDILASYLCASVPRFVLDNYSPIISQFIPHIYRKHLVDKKFIEKVIGVRAFVDNDDPLFQILTYRYVFAVQWPEHVYVCPVIENVPKTDYRVWPSYVIDPASIFHGKGGIIAYCMTVRDFMLMEAQWRLGSFLSSLDHIHSKVLRKLRCNKQLNEFIQQQDAARACDIDFIESIIHDEIEEANKLMEKYGIMRIAFPLS